MSSESDLHRRGHGGHRGEVREKYDVLKLKTSLSFLCDLCVLCGESFRNSVANIRRKVFYAMPNSRMALPPKIFSLSASERRVMALIICTVPCSEFHVADGSP